MVDEEKVLAEVRKASEELAAGFNRYRERVEREAKKTERLIEAMMRIAELEPVTPATKLAMAAVEEWLKP